MKSKLDGKIILYSNFLEKEPFPKKTYHYPPNSSLTISAAGSYLHSFAFHESTTEELMKNAG